MTTDWGSLGKYGLIAADPPWKFRAGHSNRSTENHYPTMPLAAIKALPVADLAAKDCALLLWTTPPFLKQSLEVMTAWQFRFVSVAFTWIKLKKHHADALFMDNDVFISLGHTTRKSSEMCLLGKRGRPTRLNADVPEVILAKRREHSRKPDQFYARCERLYPGPYLELFSRTARRGWDAFGNETGKFSGSPNSPVHPIDGHHDIAGATGAPEAGHGD